MKRLEFTCSAYKDAVRDRPEDLTELLACEVCLKGKVLPDVDDKIVIGDPLHAVPSARHRGPHPVNTYRGNGDDRKSYQGGKEDKQT